MRITYFLTTADAGAGTENAVITQANGMAEDADVEVLSVHRTARRPHFAVSKRARLRYIAALPKVRTPSLVIPDSWDNQFDAVTDPLIERALRTLRTDILVTTTPALAYLAARFVPRRVRIVHQEHRASFFRGRGFEPLQLAAPRLSRIVALSEVTAVWLRKELPDATGRIIVVPNAIDVAGAFVSDRRQNVVVTAGRLVPAKQFEHIVHAFARTRDAHPDWHLRIYGDGPSRAGLQTAIRRLGLETSVSLPGVVPDLPTVLAQASVFTLASRSEAFSLVIAEAQAAGVPVVSYDTQVGPRDILEKTGGGIVVPLNSRAGLAAGMDFFMSDINARDQYGERGRSGSWAYDRQAVHGLWLKVFANVLGPADAPIGRREPAAPASMGTDIDVDVDLHATGRVIDVENLRDRVQHELNAARVPWRPGPSTGTIWRLATEQTHIEAVLVALAKAGEENLIVTARLRREPLADAWAATGDAPVLASAADELILAQSDGQRIASIELWHRSEEGLYARPGSPIGPGAVDSSTWNDWMEAGTTTVSGRPYWSETTFPIDVVYTWVDGDDPAWQRRRAPYLDEQLDMSSDAVRDARYRNRDELYYSIASVKRYMPWVNRIFVVTDRQEPARVITEFPDVTVIDHSEIFPDAGVLPVFNSHAIEASIHRIPGLAEHYLYLNDDFLIARPLSVDQFFFSNGVAKFFPHGVEINYDGQDDKPHLQAGANNRALLLDLFGVEITRSLMHTPYPQRRSVVEELEARCPEVFDQTRRHRFRDPDDFSVPSSLAPHYGYLTGKFVPGTIGYRYASLRSDALASRLRHILDDRRVAVVAIAEPTNADRRHRDEADLLRSFLEELIHRGNPAPAVPLTTPVLEATLETAATGIEGAVKQVDAGDTGTGSAPTGIQDARTEA